MMKDAYRKYLRVKPSLWQVQQSVHLALPQTHSENKTMACTSYENWRWLKSIIPCFWWLTSSLSDWPVILVFHMTRPERWSWCSLPREQPKSKAFGNEATTRRGRSFLPGHLSTQFAPVICVTSAVTYCKLFLNVFLWLCLQVTLFRRRFISLSFKTVRQAQQVWECRRRPPQSSRVNCKLSTWIFMDFTKSQPGRRQWSTWHVEYV